MTLCTHGVQTGEGYECSSCVTSPTFAEQLDTHLRRLAAERVPVVEERIGEDPQRCPNCAPGYDCERGIYTPVTPAEERTGVSDVQHAVVGEVEAIRRLLPQLRVAEREYAREPVEYLKDTADDIAEGLMRRLDRIEQWVRGGQR